MPILLAIVRDAEAESPAAALYNPAEDRIVIARTGDRILGRSVLRVSSTWVELGFADSVVRLELEADGGGGQ